MVAVRRYFLVVAWEGYVVVLKQVNLMQWSFDAVLFSVQGYRCDSEGSDYLDSIYSLITSNPKYAGDKTNTNPKDFHPKKFINGDLRAT